MIYYNDRYREDYLGSLFGSTYSEDADRYFPRMPSPKLYTAWEEARPERAAMDLSAFPRENIFVASDHHFGHRNIIKYAKRPFSMDDVAGMDEEMIRRHNAVVATTDVVFLLGDIAFCDIERANKILARMHGYKILIIGNHDWDKKQRLKAYDVDEVYVSYFLNLPDQGFDFLMTHAPFDSHHMMNPGLVNLHGHIHSNIMPHSRHVNMCVEHIDYTPVNLRDLVMKTERQQRDI